MLVRFLIGIIIFQVLVLLVIIATVLTPNQNCPMIISYYDVFDRPIEVDILKSEHSYVARGDPQVLCRYKRVTIDSLAMEYYNGGRSD